MSIYTSVMIDLNFIPAKIPDIVEVDDISHDTQSIGHSTTVKKFRFFLSC